MSLSRPAEYCIYCDLHVDECACAPLTIRYKREWRSWSQMVQRCTNPARGSYPRYGGRGIRVCDRWLGRGGFARFMVDMGERPDGASLDRIDNSRGYEPGNCRWATVAEQARNTCRNRNITIDGVTHCMADWCAIVGIPLGTFRTRIRAGLAPREALFGGPRHRRDAHLVMYDGQLTPLYELAKRFGLKRTTVKQRLERGWPLQRALEERP